MAGMARHIIMINDREVLNSFPGKLPQGWQAKEDFTSREETDAFR
jgi:hypothetical protein